LNRQGRTGCERPVRAARRARAKVQRAALQPDIVATPFIGGEYREDETLDAAVNDAANAAATQAPDGGTTDRRYHLDSPGPREFCPLGARVFVVR
jgi:hypothetical protein